MRLCDLALVVLFAAAAALDHVLRALLVDMDVHVPSLEGDVTVDALLWHHQALGEVVLLGISVPAETQVARHLVAVLLF